MTGEPTLSSITLVEILYYKHLENQSRIWFCFIFDVTLQHLFKTPARSLDPCLEKGGRMNRKEGNEFIEHCHVFSDFSGSLQSRWCVFTHVVIKAQRFNNFLNQLSNLKPQSLVAILQCNLMYPCSLEILKLLRHFFGQYTILD